MYVLLQSRQLCYKICPYVHLYIQVFICICSKCSKCSSVHTRVHLYMFQMFHMFICIYKFSSVYLANVDLYIQVFICICSKCFKCSSVYTSVHLYMFQMFQMLICIYKCSSVYVPNVSNVHLYKQVSQERCLIFLVFYTVLHASSLITVLSQCIQDRSTSAFHTCFFHLVTVQD